MAAGGDQRVHQRVAVGEVVLDAHAVLAQRREQLDRAGRRVEADGHADLRVLGRERGQQHRDPALGGRQVAQARVVDREAGDARAALGVGDVARHRHADRRGAGVALLERDHAAEQPPVELGDRDLRGRVERREPGVGLQPGRARGGRADGLDHGDVERGERRRVPVLPRLADPFARLGGVVAGAAAAGGEHRRDQRVDVARRAAPAPARVRRRRGAACSSTRRARWPRRPRSRAASSSTKAVFRSGGASGRSRRRRSGRAGSSRASASSIDTSPVPGM